MTVVWAALVLSYLLFFSVTAIASSSTSFSKCHPGMMYGVMAVAAVPAFLLTLFVGLSAIPWGLAP